ncbi:MAG: hypothetical protein M3409_09360 [Gemmatimonadota bacterium]|jgi:hypothetical protein|nr:hypothetical protein [Gemmatimonadota bacterium]
MSAPSLIPSTIPFRTLKPLSAVTLGLLLLLLVVGAATVFLGFGGADPNRIWRGLLFNWLFWSSLAMGMVMLAVTLHLTDADWAWSFRRLALGGAAFLPISMLILPLLFLGSEHFFHHWLHVEGDPVIDAKRSWLNLGAMFTRDVIGVAVLFGLSGWFAHLALRADVYGSGDDRQRGWYGRFGLLRGYRGAPEEAARSRRMMTFLGPILAIWFALVWGMIAIDLAMSLEPHWFSTMFPVAFFMTAFHGGIAATAIAATLLRSRAGLEPFMRPGQFHDLGKLLFAFSVFWMYLNWSQYVVIWYGILPWEQEWFVHRFEQPFAPFVQAAVMLIFVLPFFGLLTRPPKKVPTIVATFAALILVGHWLERFLLIAPSLYEEGHGGLPLGLPEIGIALGFGALFVGTYLWFLRTFPLLPSPATLAAREPSTIQVPVDAHGATL